MINGNTYILKPSDFIKLRIPSELTLIKEQHYNKYLNEYDDKQKADDDLSDMIKRLRYTESHPELYLCLGQGRGGMVG